MLTERLLQTLTPSIRELATQVGVPYQTLRSWRSGLRSPSSDAMRTLADLADRRADVLRGLAVELRRVADGTREA
jgi:DNA-binding transcriptional regulator YiaG